MHGMELTVRHRPVKVSQAGGGSPVPEELVGNEIAFDMRFRFWLFSNHHLHLCNRQSLLPLGCEGALRGVRVAF